MEVEHAMMQVSSVTPVIKSVTKSTYAVFLQ